MTVALVHDFLTQRGGAERVVLHLARCLRDPVIVTALYAPDDTYPDFAHFDVRALHQASGQAARRFRHRALSYPRMFRSLRLDHADLAVISTSAFAHHVRHPRSAVYWHTPPRFLYDPAAYLPWPADAPRAALTTAAHAAAGQLRRQDRAAARSHRHHAANSRRTADRLRAHYGIEAPVLHPPFDTAGLAPVVSEPDGPARGLVVSRLLPYKRVDLAIAACRRVGIPLTVIGDGPDRRRLERLARGSVTFRPAVSDAELADAYASHALVLCPGQEDFGYVPLEAAWSGRPVVAAAGAGAEESVIEGTSGVLVRGTDAAAWARAVESVLARRWIPADLRLSASRFGAGRFAAGLAQWLSPVADPSDVLRPLRPDLQGATP